MSLNAASLVDLKAELARKQSQFQQERLNPEQRDIRLQEEKVRKSTAWLKANRGVHQRNQRDLLEEAENTKSLERAEIALKAKAALYERMRQGQLTEEEQQRYLVDFERKMMERMDSVAREAEEEDRRRAEAKGVAAATGDDDEEDDYHRRHRYTAEDAPRGQQGPIFADRYDANELVDYVDEFGRTRQCKRRDLPALQALDAEAKAREQHAAPPRQWQQAPAAAAAAPARTTMPSAYPGSTDSSGPTLGSADMQREAERRAWEENQRSELATAHRGPTHYETVRQNEIRQLGTAYFQFSTDEEERAKQMEALNTLREETEIGRQRRETLLQRRADAKAKRLAKIRLRKAAAGLGLDGEPEAKRSPALASNEAGGIDVSAVPGTSEQSIDAFLREVWSGDGGKSDEDKS